jgi:hypothetical protein
MTLNLQYLGFASHQDRIIVRGKPSEQSFSAFYLLGGRIRACLTLNRARDQKAARRLIQAGAMVDPERLADENVDLMATVVS